MWDSGISTYKALHARILFYVLNKYIDRKDLEYIYTDTDSAWECLRDVV